MCQRTRRRRRRRRRRRSSASSGVSAVEIRYSAKFGSLLQSFPNPKIISDNPSLVDKKAEKHILDGDGPASGGHFFGTGVPGKSELPKSWSDEKILSTISDIATDPKTQWSSPDGRGYQAGSGNRDGVNIKVVYDKVKDRIVTGYPTNTPKNPKL
ncbi:EndoU domain-containing protein [Pseudomonas syringae]|uniref:EndoU domain-containing protein n=1 Tax=Pseudomonas syringae TaxID=317 RepID=UPI002E124997|nr:EndoU domain-containing protein [Pseudomonas syringae]